MKVHFDTRMMWLTWIVFDCMYDAKLIKLIRMRYETILADDFLWQDLVLRHNFVGVKPWNAREKDIDAFDHAMVIFGA